MFSQILFFFGTWDHVVLPKHQ